MKFIIITLLTLMLLIASATAGTATQSAQNTVIGAGDGTVITESITLTASADGQVTQDAQNNAIVIGDDVTVDQSVVVEGQGSTVDQNMIAGSANNVVGAGDDASVDQSLSMTAIATDGNTNQLAVQNAAWAGDDAAVTQTTTIAAAANSGAVNQFAGNAALFTGDSATINQNITGTAIARDDIVQVFGNLGMGFGNGARYTQVVKGGANSTDAGVFQFGGNFAGVPGAAFTGMKSNQSVLFSAIAGEDVLQIGGNAAFAHNGATLGQEVGMSADAEDVAQFAGNFASAGNNFAANQAIALTVESDEGNVAQIGGNFFVDRNLAGGSNSRLGQMISARSTGADNSIQFFGNYAWLNDSNGATTYTVAQSNVANQTVNAGGVNAQVQLNWAFWDVDADGPLAQDIDGRAQGGTITQFQFNTLIPV